MLDIKFVRENPEIVKQNIRNKFQDSKLELVDKVLELDKENREIKQEVEALRAEKNKISKQIGALMGQGKRDEAEEIKKKVAESGNRIEELSAREKEVEEELLKNMMVIPNIIDPSVPIGKDDSENVEVERFGEPLFLISKSLTTQILWKALMASIWTVPEEWPETDFIISWAILQDFTRL